jgi:predicted amidophosphoribosyltransferase
MICPYCKTELTEADDIVCCSVCEMPHHRECWAENGGCTTFGCIGTIREANDPEAQTLETYASETQGPAAQASEGQRSVAFSAGERMRPYGGDVLFCTKCGNRQTMADNFCGQCGARLKKYR